MRLIDQIALNRLISIVTSFILNLIKVLSPKKIEDIKKPKRKKIFPWRNKNE